jgi:Dipeptidase
MKLKKAFAVLLIALLVAGQSLFACTIFAVGKDATVDGSTMTSHTCDSNGDDFRLWIIPSMEAGYERDVVLNGRAGADYSEFPTVKNYGDGGMVLGTYTFDKPSNQYLHCMYSFINDKGLAMGESTCSYERNTDQGKKIKAAFGATEGIYDCYMLQDLALETCSTAREAVEFMGKMIDEYGWNGLCECINICDGNEAWVFEAYGGNVWAAVRVPDNAVFVAANRARIIHIDFNDSENYRWSENIKSFAIENDLWDGKGDFEPANIYAPNKSSLGCTLREWRALSLLDPSLNLDPHGDPDDYPMFVVPKEKVSVDTIHRLCSDHYDGTEFDCARTVEAGPYGNPISNNNVYRPINMFRCTYIQIATVKAWLPEEVRCLAYYGWGAPDSTYLTPVFASQRSLAPQFGIGKRLLPYDSNSGWWVACGVQQTATINYNYAIDVIHGIRDPKMAAIYESTARAQDFAASLCNVGLKDQAIDYLTSYATTVANDWHNTWKALDADLRSTLMFGNIDMKVPKQCDWWKNVVNENLGDKLRPMDQK